MIDRFLDKVFSRKLLVWVVATGLAYQGFLDSQDWIIISSLYLGTQGIIDIKKTKGALNEL